MTGTMQQAERYAEITSLRAELDGASPRRSREILHRLDDLIEEAAAVDRVETPGEAITSLEIALHAMGADREAPTSEERLILLAIGFLQTRA